ncbi:MAG: beta-ketoacyl-[acyl-carrier-protein] synthase family protein [Phycisphaerae bacterium]
MARSRRQADDLLALGRPVKSARAVVTGLGAICAAGSSVRRVMRSLYAGERRPGPPRNIAADLTDDYPVFEVLEPLDALYKSRAEAQPSRTAQLSLIAAEEALSHAKLDLKTLRSLRVGVCMGTTVGCTLNDEPFYRQFRRGQRPDVHPVQRYLDSNPAKFLAATFGLSGPAATVANACSSGTDAIGLAKAWVEQGQCDIALAGGCDELSRIPYLGFIQLLISSRHPCRPFDKNRQGLNLGEGAGVVILERDSVAKKRGVCALALVAGYGSFADAYHTTAPHPNGLGLKRAIQHALRTAGLDHDRVGFVNTHGTATPDNDRVEGRVLAQLFTESIPAVATKAYTGHTLGAAGGLEAILTLQALHDERLPATPGFDEEDADVAIRPTRENTSIRTDVAISTSLAFGGNNAVLVFQR